MKCTHDWSYIGRGNHWCRKCGTLKIERNTLITEQPRYVYRIPEMRKEEMEE